MSFWNCCTVKALSRLCHLKMRFFFYCFNLCLKAKKLSKGNKFSVQPVLLGTSQCHYKTWFNGIELLVGFCEQLFNLEPFIIAAECGTIIRLVSLQGPRSMKCSHSCQMWISSYSQSTMLSFLSSPLPIYCRAVSVL